tara:strand:+ start:108 stop:320 length:213 start_codon:yes stop_codon:yes gene_type:complete
LNDLINQRLQELEEKISFQEDAMQKIEAELIYHQKKVTTLEKLVADLQLSLKKIENNVGSEKLSDLPPHF